MSPKLIFSEEPSDNLRDTFKATDKTKITENDEVFLMGIVSKKEADAAVEVTRNISGVNRVFKAFEYIQ